jgi:hypothetical protein
MVLAISGAYGGWNEGWKRNPIAWSATIKFAMDGKISVAIKEFLETPDHPPNAPYARIATGTHGRKGGDRQSIFRQNSMAVPLKRRST